MEALGALNPIEEARAKLQEKIADFLAARARLSRLMSSPNLQVKGQAQGLYAVQTQLESKLQNEMYPKLQSVQTGAWSISDVISLGAFTGQIITQLNNVHKLEQQAGVVPVSSGVEFSTMAIGIPALVVLGLLGGYMLARQ